MNREDTKKAIEIMQAFVDGKIIEGRDRRGNFNRVRPFLVCPSPAWDFGVAEYRIKAPMPDSIDWSHVNDKFNFMARDQNGLCYVYERKPTHGVNMWNYGGHKGYAKHFSSYKQGDVPWDESLVERPKMKEYVVEIDLGYD